MSTQLQLRRGTTAQHSTFTGASGEITIDTDKKTVVVHDGTTAGGRALPQFDSSGNLGIGTSSIGYKLTVNGNAGFADRIVFTAAQSTYGAYSVSRNGSNQLQFQGGSGGYLWRNSADTGSLLTLDDSGNLGLGVTPSAWGTGSGGPQVIEGTWGSITVGNLLGTSLNGNARYDGTNWRYKISSSAFAHTIDSAGYKWYTAPSGTAGNAITFTQAMTLDVNAQLSVTPSGGGNFTAGNLSDSTAYGMLSFNGVRTSAGITGIFGSSSTGNLYYNASGGAFNTHEFRTGGTTRAIIDSSGNLLVGTTTYSSPSSGIVLTPSFTSANASGIGISHPSGTASGAVYSYFFYNGTGIGSITQSGTTAVAYNTSSDYRLKEDIQTVVTPIDRLNQLKPVNFAWKVDGSRCDGFLAHELQEVIPEAATGHKDEMRTEEYEVTPAVKDEDGNVITEAVIGEREVPVYQGIDQSKIVPLLTAALQEAVAKIESLTQRIEALEYTKQGE